jgi:hypothetical protein
MAETFEHMLAPTSRRFTLQDKALPDISVFAAAFNAERKGSARRYASLFSFLDSEEDYLDEEEFNMWAGDRGLQFPGPGVITRSEMLQAREEADWNNLTQKLYKSGRGSMTELMAGTLASSMLFDPSSHITLALTAGTGVAAPALRSFGKGLQSSGRLTKMLKDAAGVGYDVVIGSHNASFLRGVRTGAFEGAATVPLDKALEESSGLYDYTLEDAVVQVFAGALLSGAFEGIAGTIARSRAEVDAVTDADVLEVQGAALRKGDGMDYGAADQMLDVAIGKSPALESVWNAPDRQIAPADMPTVSNRNTRISGLTRDGMFNTTTTVANRKTPANYRGRQLKGRNGGTTDAMDTLLSAASGNTASMDKAVAIAIEAGIAHADTPEVRSKLRKAAKQHAREIDTEAGTKGLKTTDSLNVPVSEVEGVDFGGTTKVTAKSTQKAGPKRVAAEVRYETDALQLLHQVGRKGKGRKKALAELVDATQLSEAELEKLAGALTDKINKRINSTNKRKGAPREVAVKLDDVNLGKAGKSPVLAATANPFRAIEQAFDETLPDKVVAAPSGSEMEAAIGGDTAGVTTAKQDVDLDRLRESLDKDKTLSEEQKAELIADIDAFNEDLGAPVIKCLVG